MNFNNIKLALATIAGVAFCATLGGNVHAAEFNKNRIGHTNYSDEITYSGRVYELFKPGSETEINNNISSTEMIYYSQNQVIDHIIKKVRNTSKVIVDRWYWAPTYQKLNTYTTTKEQAEIDKTIDEAIKSGDKYSKTTQPGGRLSVDLGHIIGWRKIGKTWFFVNNGKITKTHTNASRPRDGVYYGYVLSNGKDTNTDFNATNPYNKNAVLHKQELAGGRFVIKKYSRLTNTIFTNLLHTKQVLLVDQWSGKVLYNKRQACYQWDYWYDRHHVAHMYVKKFFMKSDKHGHIIKGTYTGLKYRWTFGKNGVLLKTRKI